MKRLCILLALFMSPSLSLAQDSLSFRVVGWNLESGESSIRLIRRQMADKDGVDIWGLSEVPSSNAISALESAAEEGENADFEVVFGSTGGNDRLAVLFDTTRFERVGEPEELSFVQLTPGLRAPLVVRLKGRQSGTEFLFMVNHLKRGGVQNPTRIQQAELINQWAQDQELPIITVGDFNFDYDVDLGDAGFPHRDRGFDELIRDGVFVYLRPDRLLKTNADDNFNSVLDFVFVAHAPFAWRGESRILERDGDEPAEENDFDDSQQQSDHRPVDAIFTLRGEGDNLALTETATKSADGSGNRSEILDRLEEIERELVELRKQLTE